MDDGHTKVLLDPSEMPKRWYNILPDLPAPFPPPLNPGTKEPIGPEDLAPIFPMEVIRQEVSQDRYVDIPDELQEAYLRLGRPSPLYRAKRFEAALKTPARIYYKREDLSPTGSHKPNTAIAQAYYGLKEGVERFTTETGAGQWGSALSLACAYFNLGCTVFMVRCSYDQKPYRRHVMSLMGADVHPSPSDQTTFGKKLLKDSPDHPGSLGIAISEALEASMASETMKYSLGSVLNHVLMHQSVIGLETMKQLEMLDETADFMVSSVGGGSNFAGLTYPMIGEVLNGRADTQFVAVEPTSVPTMTEGQYDYDFGDTACTTPLLKMFTLGHDFVPPAIHAGGLRYHGVAPSISILVDAGAIQPRAYPQVSTYDAGSLFARTEGIIPAPEASHAVKGAVELALEAKAAGEEKVIVFNLSGHGLLDLEGFSAYMSGALTDD